HGWTETRGVPGRGHRAKIAGLNAALTIAIVPFGTGRGGARSLALCVVGAASPPNRDLGSHMAAKAKDNEPEEAVGGGEQGAEKAAAASRLPLRLIAIVAGGLVLAIGLGTGAYMLFGGSHESHAAAPVAKPAVFVDLPEVLVNLSNAGSDRTQYLKVKVVLELPDALLMQQIQPVMPRITDTFQTYLRELRPTDLDGSAGLYRLKEELTRPVNVPIAPSKGNARLFHGIAV